MRASALGLMLTVGFLGCTQLAWSASTADAGRNETLQRGEYIARAAACLSCHTEAGGKAFAGGAALKTPFGTLYAPNITPDKAGIAGWEEQDFERAVRAGVRKDGTLLYPGMPYTNYAHMSRDDMYALWSYLRLIPAVSHTTPQDALIFPFNLRGGLGIWQSLYYRPAAYSPEATRSEAWNRGHYLVEALGHCETCHSAASAGNAAVAAGTDAAHRLTPAQLAGWYVTAPVSDPLAAIGGWKVEQVADYLRSGQAPGAAPVSAGATAPAAAAVHDSLSHLSDPDRLAMATYLKDPARAAAPEHGHEMTTTSEENLREGKLLYGRSCASCHGANGQGAKGIGALSGNAALTAPAPYRLNLVMLEGVKAHGRTAAMESFAGKLDDQQIADLSNFIRSAWGNHADANATPWVVGNWRLLTQPPPNTPAATLACPTLDEAVLKPALTANAKTLHAAAHDHAQLDALVSNYLHQRPQSSSAEVIAAMSTAYCRSGDAAGASVAERTAEVSDYAQQIARLLSQPRTL